MTSFVASSTSVACTRAAAVTFRVLFSRWHASALPAHQPFISYSVKQQRTSRDRPPATHAWHSFRARAARLREGAFAVQRVDLKGLRRTTLPPAKPYLANGAALDGANCTSDVESGLGRSGGCVHVHHCQVCESCQSFRGWCRCCVKVECIRSYRTGLFMSPACQFPHA